MNLVISIIVGAVIGYITNWLAIKMLFRPHDRMEIFGLHVPFTPGLIPKEKDRIAKSIGDAVGEHLLTSDVLTEVLSGERINSQLQKWIINKIEYLKSSGKTIKDLLGDLFNEKNDLLLKAIQYKTSAFICNQLANEAFIDKLAEFVENKIYNQYKDSFKELVTEKIKQFITHLSTSQELREELEAIVASKLKKLEKEERALSEIISAELVNIIYSYVNNNKRKISERLAKLLKNPFVKIKLKTALTDAISQNTSKVVTIFINPESIAQKVVSAMEAYFDNGENDDNILLIARILLDNILKTRVSAILKEIPVESKKQILSQLVETSSNYISSSEVQDRISDFINNNLIITSENIRDDLANLLKERIRSLTGTPAFNESIHELTGEIIGALINTPISLIVENIGDETISRAIDSLMDIYKEIIKSKLPKALETLDIPKIIEEKINTFDAAYVEELILEIASKELSAITWFGALLGGIMGLISALMQLIM